jgi:hypothetical protein
MKDFKFFQKSKPIFRFELTNYIEHTPESNMIWSMDYSECIREWMSELYFTNTYSDSSLHRKYFSRIDRVVELIETPRITERRRNSPKFTFRVKIWRTNEEYMVVGISYPINDIIYN